MATLERIHMTPAQFRQLPETNEPTELINGELIVSPTPVNKHQGIVGESYFFLKGLAKQNPDLGQVIVSPMDVWLGENCVQPDVFWVSKPQSLCKLGEDGYWYGAPDLVIEVLSPSTAHKDRGIKFDLYEKHGVREYWLFDPDGRYIEVFRLLNGRFERLGAFGVGQSFSSAVLANIEIQVDMLLVSE
jgi:Uma2 family endonuclease